MFIFNYRGYGKSGGKANEAGIYLDVMAAIDQLRARGWEHDQTIIFGRSLGAAVGLDAAIKIKPAGLIMESAFTSIQAMGNYHYPLLNTLLGWLIDADYNNLEKIPSLQSPLLLIHGKRDTICPPQMAEELFNMAPENKLLHWIEGADHNNGFVVDGENYKLILQQTISSSTWTGFNG